MRSARRLTVSPPSRLSRIGSRPIGLGSGRRDGEGRVSNNVTRSAGKGRSWRELLAEPEPLLLPCAHDALSARLIARAGFKAYSIGGFPLVGARYGLPDIGLVGLGEMAAGIRDIVEASALAVLVDGDHGYGDAKNVARTIRTYEGMGVAAIFI